jgi:hypothetical protein
MGRIHQPAQPANQSRPAPIFPFLTSLPCGPHPSGISSPKSLPCSCVRRSPLVFRHCRAVLSPRRLPLQPQSYPTYVWSLGPPCLPCVVEWFLRCQRACCHATEPPWCTETSRLTTTLTQHVTAGLGCRVPCVHCLAAEPFARAPVGRLYIHHVAPRLTACPPLCSAPFQLSSDNNAKRKPAAS